MRDAIIPPNSLVLIELDPGLYNPNDRQKIVDYVKDHFGAQALVTAASGQPTNINVLMPPASDVRAE